MGPEQPSVGRIVHYVSYGTPGGEFKSECRAAIITDVNEFISESEKDGEELDVSMCVLNPNGLFLNQHVPHDEELKKGGTWHWPERV
jgi:hypothetical protein